MRGVEWVFSAVLALVFLVTGVTKVFRYEQARRSFPWVKDLPRALAMIIGCAEILGALGLILPVATGIYPQLTPIAAIALGVLMLSAVTFHVLRHESDEAMLNGLILLLAAFVAYSRWSLLP